MTAFAAFVDRFFVRHRKYLLGHQIPGLAPMIEKANRRSRNAPKFAVTPVSTVIPGSMSLTGNQTSSGERVTISSAECPWNSASRSKFLGNRVRLDCTIAWLALAS